MDIIRIFHIRMLQQLTLERDGGDGFRIEEFAIVGAAQQFLELGVVQREDLCATLGKRSISVVDKTGGEIEQHGLRKRRCRIAVHGVYSDPATAYVLEQLIQSVDIKNVPQAFPVGLQNHRESGVLAGRLHQIC